MENIVRNGYVRALGADAIDNNNSKSSAGYNSRAIAEIAPSSILETPRDCVFAGRANRVREIGRANGRAAGS